MSDGGQALIDHGLNRENHSFLKQSPFSFSSEMRNLGILMHQFSNSMSAVLFDDGVTVAGRVFINAEADVSGGIPGFHLFNPFEEGFSRDPAESLGLLGGLAHDVHAGSVRDEAVFFHGDVEIHDVSLFQNFLSRRNSVADDVVHGRAEGEFEAILADAGRDGFVVIDDPFFREFRQMMGSKRPLLLQE